MRVTLLEHVAILRAGTPQFTAPVFTHTSRVVDPRVIRTSIEIMSAVFREEVHSKRLGSSE